MVNPARLMKLRAIFGRLGNKAGHALSRYQKPAIIGGGVGGAVGVSSAMKKKNDPVDYPLDSKQGLKPFNSHESHKSIHKGLPTGSTYVRKLKDIKVKKKIHIAPNNPLVKTGIHLHPKVKRAKS